MTLSIRTLRTETWPLRASFNIARSRRTSTTVVYLELQRDGVCGHSECAPTAHYGESPEAAETAIRAAVEALASTEVERIGLGEIVPAGAARNAIDCALWDLECKARGVRFWELCDRPRPTPAVTVETISIDEPDVMRAAAERSAHRPRLKIKLDADDIVGRVAAVHAGAPRSELVVDVNEAWTFDLLRTVAPELARLGVAMIEQPLPAGADAALEGYESPVPLCADESCHTRTELDDCARRYQLVNVKLDKTGGLTEALALSDAARERGLGTMVGCMLGTSLAMAPATLIAGDARFVDLDGPLWLVDDRASPLRIEASRVGLPEPTLWG